MTNATLEPTTLIPAVPDARRSRNFGTQALVRYAERYECPNCETVIPPSHRVRHQQNEAERHVNHQRITIVCPACRNAYRGVFTNADGLLLALSVERITDDAEVGVLRSGAEAAAGEVRQLHDVSVPGVPADPREPTARQVRAEPTAREMELATLVQAEARHRSKSQQWAQSADRYWSRARCVAREITAGKRVPPAAVAEDTQAEDAKYGGADAPPVYSMPADRPVVVGPPVAEPGPPEAHPERVLDTSTSQIDELPLDDPFGVDDQHGPPRAR